MTNFLLFRCLLKNKSVLATRWINTLLLATAMLIAGNGKAQLYWNTNGLTNTITATNWGLVAGGPFTTAWSASSNIVFTTNSLISYAATNPAVGNVSVTAGTTTWTGAGTYSTGAVIRTFDIAGGAILTWSGQNVSVVPGTGFIKNGAGTWNIGAQANNYPGGFTMNAGTFTFTGNNAFGSGALTINGGVVTPASAAARTIANNITIGGNFQVGGTAGTGNVTFNGTVALGAATRIITIGNTGTYTFGGIISGGAGSGLTVATASTGRIVLSNAGNTYSGPTTINSGILQAGVANSLPATTALSLANTAGAQFLLNNFNTIVGSIAGGGATGGNIVLGTGGLTTGA